MSSGLHNLSILDQTPAATQVAPDAVIALLPYAVPVLEERLQAQEVSGIRLLYTCCFLLLASSTLRLYMFFWHFKITQGEQTEELRLSLLHLVTEIIASARKVTPLSAHTCQLACANSRYVCRFSLFACKLYTLANGNIAHQTAGFCLFITVLRE